MASRISLSERRYQMGLELKSTSSERGDLIRNFWSLKIENCPGVRVRVPVFMFLKFMIGAVYS